MCCSVLQCVAVCCSELQCVAVCCSGCDSWQVRALDAVNKWVVLQCAAVCCSAFQCVAVRMLSWWRLEYTRGCEHVGCVAMCCNVLQCVAMCCCVCNILAGKGANTRL